jgi:hypothetical protein
MFLRVIFRRYIRIGTLKGTFRPSGGKHRKQEHEEEYPNYAFEVSNQLRQKSP